MALVNRLDEATRKLLVKSRNRIASMFILQPPKPAVVPPQIDIQEPLTLLAGERKDVPFIYRSGIPQSTRFELKWFINETDAEQLQNALTTNIPTWEITPNTPEPDTGEAQFGIVTLTAPNVMMDHTYYGALTIYQPD